MHRAFPVINAEEAERLCHQALSHYRYRNDREFFKDTAQAAIAPIIEEVLKNAQLLDHAIGVDSENTVKAIAVLSRQLDESRTEVRKLRSKMPDIYWSELAELKARIEGFNIQKEKLLASTLLADNLQAHLELRNKEIEKLKKDIRAQDVTMKMFFEQRAKDSFKAAPECKTEVQKDLSIARYSCDRPKPNDPDYSDWANREGKYKEDAT